MILQQTASDIPQDRTVLQKTVTPSRIATLLQQTASDIPQDRTVLQKTVTPSRIATLLQQTASDIPQDRTVLQKTVTPSRIATLLRQTVRHITRHCNSPSAVSQCTSRRTAQSFRRQSHQAGLQHFFSRQSGTSHGTATLLQQSASHILQD